MEFFDINYIVGGGVGVGCWEIIIYSWDRVEEFVGFFQVWWELSGLWLFGIYFMVLLQVY